MWHHTTFPLSSTKAENTDGSHDLFLSPGMTLVMEYVTEPVLLGKDAHVRWDQKYWCYSPYQHYKEMHLERQALVPHLNNYPQLITDISYLSAKISNLFLPHFEPQFLHL
jgi:hypothetical protein